MNPDPLTDAEKWRIIAAHWIKYAHYGASVFDWDYDSRPVMAELTNEEPFQFLPIPEDS